MSSTYKFIFGCTVKVGIPIINYPEKIAEVGASGVWRVLGFLESDNICYVKYGMRLILSKNAKNGHF